MRTEPEFEIQTRTPDREDVSIPRSDFAETDRILRRLLRLCAEAGVSRPQVSVWRLEPASRRALSRAEIEATGWPADLLEGGESDRAAVAS